MSGFWLPLGLVLASIGLAATLIAKKHGRISDETYKLIGVVWSIANYHDLHRHWLVVIPNGPAAKTPRRHKSKIRRPAGTRQSDQRSAAAAFAVH